MRREIYGQIITSIIIAIVSVLLGYFEEPLMAVLGLLIAATDTGVALLVHHSQEHVSSEEKPHETEYSGS